MIEDFLEIINNKIEQLKIIKDNFVGIDEQREISNCILKDLRVLFCKNPQLFNREIVSNINNIKYNILNSESNKYLNHLIDRERKLPIRTDGLLVMHKTKYYVGIINLSKNNNNKYCISLHNGLNKYAYENEISIIGFYKIKGDEKNIYIRVNEQSKITNINDKSLIEKEECKEILPDGCISCKCRIDCVRRYHVKGICNDYERGASTIDYSQLDTHY